MRVVEALLSTTATPFFILDLDAIDRAVADVQDAFGTALYYMLKCNSHPEVIARLARNGVGFAVSHESELRLVKAHAPSSPLLCAGPSTEPAFLRAAAEFDLKYVSISTQQSFEVWRASGCEAPGIVRFGHSSEKFGVRRRSFEDPKIVGGHVHAGTGVTPDYWARVVNEAHDLPIIDAGGGFLGPRSLAMNCQSIGDYAIRLRAERRSTLAIVEPGRYLVESALTCVSRVVDVDGDRVYLDVGSNLLPPLNAARYMSIGRLGDEAHEKQTFQMFDAGCMDLHFLPDLISGTVKRGDVVLIGNCGAYTYSLWSSFGGDRAEVIPMATFHNAAV